jgi:hypothetical protein
VRAPQLYAPTFPAITSTAEMEQLKKITATTGADFEHLASTIRANGERSDLNAIIRLQQTRTLTPHKPEWLLRFLVSTGKVTFLLILCQLARKILATIRKARGGVQPSVPEDPVTETPTTAPASTQGTQDRDVEALPRTVFFTKYPNQPS